MQCFGRSGGRYIVFLHVDALRAVEKSGPNDTKHVLVTRGSYLPYGPPNQTTSCYPGRRPTIGQWPPITTRKCSVNNKQDVALSQHRLTTPKTHTYLHTHILTLRITNIVFSWIRHFRAARVYINPSWVINFNLNFKLKLSGSVIIFWRQPNTWHYAHLYITRAHFYFGQIRFARKVHRTNKYRTKHRPTKTKANELRF